MAEQIVAAYRAQCPPGCDPVSTWAAIAVGVVGAGVSAVGQASAGKQQQGAISAAADKLKNPVLFEPTNLDTNDLLTNTNRDVWAHLDDAKRITTALNKFDYNQAIGFLNRVQPNFNAIQSQVGQNALSFAKGQLPTDVISSLQRAAAQQGVEGGFGYGSAPGGPGGMLANLNLRNLGLTSLDLSKYGTQLGIQVNQSAKSLLPNLGSVRDWLLSLPQQIDLAKYNTDITNTAGQFNTQLQNQAQQAQAQAALQGGLTGAATTAGIGNTIGSAIGGFGSLFGSGGSFGGGSASAPMISSALNSVSDTGIPNYMPSQPAFPQLGTLA